MITIDDILKWFCTKCDTEPRCDELPDLDRDLCATRSKLAKLLNGLINNEAEEKE